MRPKLLPIKQYLPVSKQGSTCSCTELVISICRWTLTLTISSQLGEMPSPTFSLDQDANHTCVSEIYIYIY